MKIPQAHLEQIEARHTEVSQEMGAPDLASEKLVALSQEYARLDVVMSQIILLREINQEACDLEDLLGNPEEKDTQMRDMLQKEYDVLKLRIQKAQRDLSLLLLPKDTADEKSALLEIRAGTGGNESALFAGDLFRMYTRYAEEKGWRMSIISSSPSDMGGYKEIIANIMGTSVFSRLKFESGVHRVQRVPATETQGRIHTSAATVAVLPEAEEVDVDIDEKDLRIDVFRASGPGGQSVNTTDSAVRITHLPTRITVSQQDEKSQHKNKAKALKVLRSRIYDQQRRKQADDRAANRKSMVGSGDRSERIRTYNFPQGRVTDHRINMTMHQLDAIMNGTALEEMIIALIAEDQSNKLAHMNEDTREK